MRHPTLPLLVSMALLAAAICRAPAAGLPAYDVTHPLPYVAHWGAYMFRIDHASMNGDGLARIIDSHGRTVKRIVKFMDIAAVRMLTWKSGSLLKVETEDNNAMIDNRDLLFEQTPSGIRTDIVLQGASVELSSVSYNGRPLLVSTDTAVLEMAADFCHACSPYDIPIVLGWNGSRYIEMNAEFKSYAQHAAQKAQHAYLTRKPSENFDPHTAIATYYVNMTMIGSEKAATTWLMQHVHGASKTWFRKYAPEFRGRVHDAQSWATAPTAATLNVDPGG